MTAREQRPRIEPEPRDDRRVTVVPVVCVAHERLEGLGVRPLDTPEGTLTLVWAQPREATVDGPLGLLHRLERAREERLELGGCCGDGEEVVERDHARAREFAARRDQGVEHQRQQVALRRERPQGHARLRMIPSAM